MPSHSMKNSEFIPAGLVLLVDFVARVPERAMDAIERERQSKHVQLISIDQMKKKYSWNPGRTTWMALLIGSTAFSLLWSMSTVMGTFHSTGQTIGGTVNELSQLGISLPPNVASQFGSIITVADKAPSFGIGDSIAITFGVIVVYGIFKFLTVMPNIDKVHMLNEEESRLEEEIRYLNGWMNDLIKNARMEPTPVSVESVSGGIDIKQKIESYFKGLTKPLKSGRFPRKKVREHGCKKRITA